MIQLRSVLNVADNNGAESVSFKCTEDQAAFWLCCDIISASVIAADSQGGIKKAKVKAVIVHCQEKRAYWQYIR